MALRAFRSDSEFFLEGRYYAVAILSNTRAQCAAALADVHRHFIITEPVIEPQNVDGVDIRPWRAVFVGYPVRDFAAYTLENQLRYVAQTGTLEIAAYGSPSDEAPERAVEAIGYVMAQVGIGRDYDSAEDPTALSGARTVIGEITVGVGHAAQGIADGARGIGDTLRDVGQGLRATGGSGILGPTIIITAVVLGGVALYYVVRNPGVLFGR